MPALQSTKDAVDAIIKETAKQMQRASTGLQVDPTRMARPETGLYVRAKNGDRWGSYDIAHLDKASLTAWLRSRGGENEWAENVVRILLGHHDVPVGG